MDLSNPDGRGKLKVTRMTISEEKTSFDYEGKVEGYGSPFLTHEYFHNPQTALAASSSVKLVRSWKMVH